MSAIDWEQTDDGIMLPVQAQPRARKNAIVGIHAGRMKVAVTQAPEKGKAIDAIIKVLASAFDVRRSQISMISGATSTQKRFLITNVNIADLTRRVAEFG